MWINVDQLIEEALDDKLFAGCSLSVQTVDSVIYEKTYGKAQTEPTTIVADTNTRWDLASLTKILFTAPLCLQLASDGILDVNEEIRQHLPNAPNGMTVRHLLMHKSGYPAWRPFFKDHIKNSDWGQSALKRHIQEAALLTPLQELPGAVPIYSDIGFIVLGHYLERLTNATLRELWHHKLPEHAKKSLTWGFQDAAATEDCPIRKRVVVGEVHDLNAAAMGGVSTHAGLFGTAHDACFAALWPMRNLYGKCQDIKPALVKQFWTAEQLGHHCLGWDTPSPNGSSASSQWPKNGVGHLGFTGCSIWLAPTQRIGISFCSNRIHPIVEGGAIPNAPPHPRLMAFKAFRPRLHQAAMQSLSKLGFIFNA